MYRFVSMTCGVMVEEGRACSTYELRHSLIDVLMKTHTMRDCHNKYGTNDTLLRRNLKNLFKNLDRFKTVKEVQEAYVGGYFPATDIRNAVMDLQINGMGRPTMLTKDEEAVMVAQA